MKYKKFGFNFDVEDRESGGGIQSKWSFVLILIFLFVVCVLWLIGILSCNGNSTAKKTSNPETEYRLNFIRNMTRDAWNAYIKVQYPQKDSYSILRHGDNTLAQSLSTLWLLNLTEQFAEAKMLLQNEPNFPNFANKQLYFDVANAVAEHIGSMLSCYALTGDEWFRDAAQKAGNSLKAAYRTKGLPFSRLCLKNNSCPHYGQFQHSLTQLGGSQHLEYRYLADLTKDGDFDGTVSKIRSILRTIVKPQGLYMTKLDYDPPHWSTMESSLRFTHFHSYLLKSYIQSNFTDHEPMEMFNQAIDAIEAAEMIVKTNQSDNGFTIVREYDVRHKRYGEEMYYSQCRLGAMFGLSVWALKKNQSNSIEGSVRMKKYLNWAEQLTETCHYVGNRTVTGFVPVLFSIDAKGTVTYDDFGYVLSYLAESYFVLYRLTKNPKYRQYAWEQVQSIAKYSPLSNGIFHSFVTVDRDNRKFTLGPDEPQAVDFIGSTLKYLYLTFTDDEDVLPMDQWIFNRAGQPLPIWGRNRMYPSKFGGFRKESEITPIPKLKEIPDSGEMSKQAKLDLIKNMTLEVWKQAHDKPNRDGVKGLDLVQMLSTLWVMDLKDEFEEGKKWIKTNNRDSLFEDLSKCSISTVSTEYIGSLLSIYALTNDTEMLDRAKQAGNMLKSLFDTPTGLPYSLLNSLMVPSSDRFYLVELAEAGGQHLEFIYLADLINDLEMKTKVLTVRTYIQSIAKPGLYKYLLNVEDRVYERDQLDRPSNQFYQYLVKSFIQSNEKDLEAIQMYKQALDTMIHNNNSMIQKSKKNAQLSYEVQDGYVNYNGCSLGAKLALGADVMGRIFGISSNQEEEKKRIEQHWRLAKEVMEACHIGYNKTKTKLAKQFENMNPNEGVNNYDNYRLTFEETAAVTESYFVLLRFTHNPTYRDYAWELLQAIHKHCRTEEGRYYHLTDVEQEYSRNNYERPQLHLLGATLKYLYLIYSEDTLLPLDQWVFNRVGQALPICGKNPAYPAEKCA